MHKRNHYIDKSEHDSRQCYNHKELLGTVEASQISRQDNWQKIQLLRKQIRYTSAGSKRAVLLLLAGGIVIQLDQTLPDDQNIYRHYRECHEDSDIDYIFCLCIGCHHQQATQNQSLSTRNAMELASSTVRKNYI